MTETLSLKAPPHSIETEQAVIAAVLLHSKAPGAIIVVLSVALFSATLVVDMGLFVEPA